MENLPEETLFVLALERLSLGPDFTYEQLMHAYHKKLFEIHPDTSVEDMPEMRVDELIHYKEILITHLKARVRSVDIEIAFEGMPGKEMGDQGYHCYKEGVAIFTDAMELYWKERLKWSHSPNPVHMNSQWRSQLLLAKDKFALVLEHFPGGMYTPDSVERIARINNWIRG